MGVFAGAEQALVDDWVRTRLTAATAELEAISAGLTESRDTCSTPGSR